MAKNDGKDSEAQFIQVMKDHWGKRVFIERLADNAEVHGRTKGRGSNRAQPSDYLVTENGEMYYAEVKSSENKISFPFSQIEKKQKNTATQQVAAGGEYVFFLHSIHNKRWYRVPAGVLLSSEKSSARWADLEPYEWELSRK